MGIVDHDLNTNSRRSSLAAYRSLKVYVFPAESRNDQFLLSNDITLVLVCRFPGLFECFCDWDHIPKHCNDRSVLLVVNASKTLQHLALSHGIFNVFNQSWIYADERGF